MDEQPRVGVGVMVFRNGSQVLLHRRKGSHGAGEYASPGGHLEHGESVEECVLREIKEEAGPQFKVKNISFVCFINLRRYMPRHYAHIQMAAEWKSGEAKVMEPDKNAGWAWYPIDSLPQPLFGTTSQAIEAYRTGKNFFEA
ncbi:MAG TPA: NUDIX domain-containing protein [Candidatus Saccharimonadales bacterium]|nr:NUDIX domain-containing protein [Candidatus Saccharimonadales bacterium]